MIKIGIDPVIVGNIRWYGVFIALAILTLIGWVAWQKKRGADISYDTIFSAALVGIPSGIVFSRLMHVLDYWEYYSQNPGQIIGGAGLAIYGAILGAALGIWVYSRFAKINYGYLTDLIAPGLILAQIVGRIGCTINGCCGGVVCDLPWAITYTNPNTEATIGLFVHPVTIYEIIFLAITFVFIYRVRDRFTPDGSLFMIYLSLYAAWRLGIDFLRPGTPFLPSIPVISTLHESQVISIVVLLIMIPLLIKRTRWRKSEPPPA